MNGRFGGWNWGSGEYVRRISTQNSILASISPHFIDTLRCMSTGKSIRLIVAFGILMAASLITADANARELSRSEDWRVFENSKECWTTTQIIGTSQKRTGGKVYLSARLARDAREPEISLTIGRSFPARLAIALVVSGKNIPLFITPPQTAFPKDNRVALQELNTATKAMYVSGGKGYEFSLDGFQRALEMIKAACS